MATRKRYDAFAAVDLPPEEILSRNRLFPRARDQARILGTEKTTARRNATQEARIAEFDRSMGFDRRPVMAAGTFGSDREPLQQGPAGKIPETVPVPPARQDALAVRAVGSTSALDAAGASISGVPALSNLSYRPTPPESFVRPGTTPLAVSAPAMTPAPMTAAVAPGPAANASVLPSPLSGVAPTATPNPAATPQPSATPMLQPTPQRSLAAGVSNSQMAQFEQPTAANPLPKTPTSPVLDANDFDVRKKNRFTGF